MTHFQTQKWSSKFLDSLCFTRFLPDWLKGLRGLLFLYKWILFIGFQKTWMGAQSLLSAVVYTLVLQLIPSTVRPSLPPSARKSPLGVLYKTSPHLQFFKALSLLPLHSHCTSLKHRSLVILHNSESLCVKSLMAQHWLTSRLTPELMNSRSHHHCLSSQLKPTLCWQGLATRRARIVNW